MVNTIRMAAVAAAALSMLCGSASGDGPATRPTLPPIVAHRGLSSEAPENTVAAFREAWAQGADVLEADFHLTADNRVVCIHDANAKRTTGLDRKVAEMTLDELRALDAGRWKDARFAGERLPTLAETLATVPADKRIFLEIKSGPAIVPAFVEELKRSKIDLDRVAMITFKDAVIPAFRAALPGVKTFYLYEFKRDKNGAWTETHDAVIARAKALGADGLDLGMRPEKSLESITPEFVSKIRSAGLEFHVWTVDDPAVARRAIELGVDSITTNRAGALRAELLKAEPADAR